MNYLDHGLRDGSDDGTVDDIYADGDYPSADERWRPIAAIAGIVFVLAAIATAVIVNGGDSASTSATVVVPPSQRTTPRLVPTLPPETMTTMTPTSRPPSPTATSTAPTQTPPPDAVPPVAPDVAARTFVYRVTGTKGLLDLVTVVYTDASGVPQTDFNVALPWSRTVVLNPGVSMRSVVATSLTGRLNCSIADGVGQNVAISTSSTMIATCSR
ncbi:MmpS family transport accessory protein [Mycobacterium sp.]|uniref:MmpS family transport accessory protein n=1 Tax=Mycobacterium sp. TaxID=1785 RepID=UPI0031D14CDD